MQQQLNLKLLILEISMQESKRIGVALIRKMRIIVRVVVRLHKYPRAQMPDQGQVITRAQARMRGSSLT